MTLRSKILTGTKKSITDNRLALAVRIFAKCEFILDKEVFVKHEKAPTAPHSRGHLLSHLCPKAHLQVKPFHMSLFPGFYDHPLQRNSLENSCLEKPLISDNLAISAISGGRTWPKLSKGTPTGQDLSYEPIPKSLRPSVTKIQPGKESMTDRRTDRQTDGRTPRIYRPPTFGVGA